ncbi:GGDEF domain-containing protein [Sulfuricurvum sp.]|uniref:sensor domain-containing phosphodiesterase n=1 Tax=Sulfuricurvum sp. TaxID=2025608 RepID=UPI002E348233|nr:GGDEF domain-containing protein [Sulfuricurvum sp.]HEX5329174.1 GGDEF domain-containing protein [Sulfuricurvum sp.]
MKLERFNLINLAIFFLIIGTLSGSFYYYERLTTLRYLSERINQSLFRLEGDIQDAFQDEHLEDIQELLDQASAIDSAMGTLSVSLDGETIAVSSSRSLRGKSIEGTYYPLAQISQRLVKESSLRYSGEIKYFSGTVKKKAVLLVELNGEYIFERLNQIVLFYGISLFLVLGIIGIGIMKGVKRWISLPLERIALRSREKNPIAEVHFIEELSILDQSLCDSVHSMQAQQIRLKEALEESLYLDRILRTVADINQLLITAKNVDELLMSSCQRLADHSGYGLCHIALKEGNGLSIEAYSSDPTGYLYPKMKISLEGDIEENSPIARAFRASSTVVMENLECEATSNEWYLIAERGQFGSMISLPLVSSVDALPLGVMTLYAKSSNGFELKEIAMLEELSDDIGFAIRSFTQREQLQYHLTTDANTDLPNRFSLVETLMRENVCALAIINIDRFSDINEVYGIGIGDAILAKYGEWLRLNIATTRKIELYKLGSDEYVLVALDCDDLDHFVIFLQGLIEATQKEVFVVDDIEIILSVTIGVAHSHERGLEHATAALKQAKRNRHSLELFSSESKKEQENNIAWYKRIKEAIEESRIVPYFQPIVDNNSGKIIKYEALMRLIERDGSALSPYLFLDIAKKTKLYPELTKIMVDKVVEVFKNSDNRVSLNLSTQDLTNPNLSDYLEYMIQTNDMGKSIIFEILESEGIDNYSSVIEFVDRFKAIGCRFAIDDFGSGYSNFDHLLKLSIDTLKIDASLIKNLPHDRNAQIFVKHICDFAHEMGISVVAEFVANEDIFHHVKAIGIDASQGYYFYEPSPTLIEER